MSGSPDEEASFSPPPSGTVERWAWDYVGSGDLEHKLHPPPVPSLWETAPVAPRRLTRPGRSARLQISERAAKSPGPEALRNPARRAQLVHGFLHHELQAAELMAWALLAFPETPRAFRGGLIHIALDEIRHMQLYADYLSSLGCRFGDFPVRDWFWTRVPNAASPAHFVAVMGMGFEGGNLDHTARFAERFRAIGDLDGAALQERVRAEEVPHVRFGVRWFRRFTGVTDFDTWVRHIPPPLSPIVMRGHPMNRPDRARSGLDEPFLDALAAWVDRAPGS